MLYLNASLFDLSKDFSSNKNIALKLVVFLYY